jgi:hypothetical protein
MFSPVIDIAAFGALVNKRLTGAGQVFVAAIKSRMVSANTCGASCGGL